MGTLIRGAQVAGRRSDVLVRGGHIAAVAPPGTLTSAPEVIEARGGALLPGLHDHHIHLLALAAALGSVRVGPPEVRDPDAFARVLRGAAHATAPGEPVRAVGYDEHVVGGLDRWRLDAVVPDHPVRVQHRSGALWILNSSALRLAGLEAEPPVEGAERDPAGRLTGRFWRLDRWLRERLPPTSPPDLGAVGRLLLRRGVTGVTDATPFERPEDLEELARATRDGTLPQRVVVTGAAELLPRPGPGLEVGPVKLLLADHVDPSLDAILAGVRAARAQGRPVAVHAVTAVSAVLTALALEEVGPMEGDRLEHGAVLPIGLARRLRELGVTVVTNPGFLVDRGDGYLVDVEPQERSDLWRCASLVDQGVAVGAGTDAPFGDPNPWVAVAAAVDRRTASGQVVGAGEALPPRRALELFLTPAGAPGAAARAVAEGAPADLVLLDAPLDRALEDPAAVEPVATLVRGAVHRW